MNETFKKIVSAIIAFLVRQWAHARALKAGWSDDAAQIAALFAGAVASLVVTAAL